MPGDLGRLIEFKVKTLLVLSICATALTASVPASAHHSGAMFDRAKVVTLSGQLIKYEFTNPHSWTRLMVGEPGGATTEWAIETYSPQNNMRRLGVNSTTLKPGDMISLRMHPLRDGSKGRQSSRYHPGGWSPRLGVSSASGELKAEVRSWTSQ